MVNQLLDDLAGGRFLAPDIEGGSGDLAALERLERGRLVENAAAGAVDDDHAVFHLVVVLSGNHAARFVVERRVGGDDVGVAQDLFQFHELDTQILAALLGDVGVVGDDVHLEGLGASRHPAADLAQPDDAQGLALEFIAGEGSALPFAALEAVVGHGNIAAEAEQDRHGVLGGRVDVAEGSVDDNDALLAGVLDVDVVDADAGAGDDLQALAGVDQRRVDLGAAAGDDGVVAGDEFVQFGNRQAELDVDLDPRIFNQGLQPFRGNFIGYENLHGDSLFKPKK